MKISMKFYQWKKNQVELQDVKVRWIDFGLRLIFVVSRIRAIRGQILPGAICSLVTVECIRG